MFLDCIGSISWWVEFVSLEKQELCVNHSYQKQTALSQYLLNSPNGVIKCSIPTLKESRRGAQKEVKIADENWQIEQWRGIQTCYLKSPFFIYYDYRLEPLFKKKYSYLHEFNWACFQVICDCLKLNTDVQWVEQPMNYKEVELKALNSFPQVFDHRHAFNPDVCILDLIFNLGPEALDYLRNQTTSS